jgi:hypothetical protein
METCVSRGLHRIVQEQDARHEIRQRRHKERRAEKARLKKTAGALIANYPDVVSGRHVVVPDNIA